MTAIVGISGSLRQKSFNTAILNAAAELAPEGTRIVIHSIRGIALYDGDAEAAQGIPEAVTALKNAIAASDGLPIAMMGASPGGFGTTLSQNAWLAVWRTLGALLYAERRMLVSRAHTLMDAEGKLIDAKTRDQIAGFVKGFAAFTERTRR